MTRNYFQFFIRNFRKYLLLNSINILGLSMGIVAALLVVLYVLHERSFDDFHRNADQLYRLEGKTNTDAWIANLGMEHARELQSGTYPEIESLVRVNGRQAGFVYKDGSRFPQKNVYQTPVNSDFFNLFSFTFSQGNSATALIEPRSMVLTEMLANRYFGDEPAIGNVLNFDSTQYTITGVIRNKPTNTHLEFDVLITNPGLYENEHFHTHTYIQLVRGADVQELEDKVINMDVAYNEFHALTDVRLLPVTDIYMHTDYAFGSTLKGDAMQQNIFLILALLIVLIASFNYINLTFAVFINKGKEVGIRKMLGESRRQIITGMLVQAVITALLSLPFIVVGLYILIPLFGGYVSVDLWQILVANPFVVLYTLILLVFVGFSSIVYPVIALRRIDVTAMVRSKLLLANGGGVRYRNMLMFVQFIFLFTLGTTAVFMHRQIDYLDQKDKGFDATDVIKVSNAFDIGDMDNYYAFKNKLNGHTHVAGVAFGPMMGDGMAPLSYKPEGSDEIFENLLSYGVGIDYFDVMGIDIVEGDFRTILENAENGRIVSLVNQSFVDRYGWQDNPIGRKIVLRPETENALNRQVSAVFNDFHFFSFKEKISPQIISLRPDPQFVNTNILVRSTPGNVDQVMKLIRSEWQTLQPDLPVQMDLMEDAVKALYIKERQTRTVGLVLSVLAIFLSVLGVSGFMIFLLGLKSKEIAIRKVMGASLHSIVQLLNRQLILTLLLSGLTGSLLSYLMLETWLEDYAYRIPLAPMGFLTVGLIIYSLVFIITGIQTARTTRTNPVSVLSEV